MVVEAELLTASERFSFDRAMIDKVAFPLGDRYPPEIFTSYFEWYSGLAHKYQPRRILEIGVRYGYTGIVFLIGARDSKGQCDTEYLGIDDESYHHGSCAQANLNFAQIFPWARMKAVRWNSFDGLPSNAGTFDLIHIDGNHDTHGVLNDLGHCWPALNPGGIIILDDYQFPQIKLAIDTWLEAKDISEEVVEVQRLETERGHCLLRKTGTKVAT